MALARSPSWDEAAPNEQAPEVWREGRQAVVSLRGEHDLSTAPALAAALAEASALGAGDVVVDLSGVLFMDAAVIKEIVDRREGLHLGSRTLTLRAPSPSAWRVLELCDLTGMVEPLDDRHVHVLPRIMSAVVRSVPWHRAQAS